MLKIFTEPNEILHRQTRPVEPADLASKKFRKLVKNMTETMRVKDGVGIAGPQVGSDLAVCVIHSQFSDPKKKTDLVLINPSWEKTSSKTETDSEGCLSVPGIFGKVKRCKKIKVRAINQEGEPVEFAAEDYFARIIQHEVDHLNGILFIEKAENLQQIDETKTL